MMRKEIAEKVMPFGEHLEELRKRLIYALWGVLPLMLVTLYFGRELLSILIAPILTALREADLPAGLQATSPLETFMAYFKISLTVTIVIAGPWIVMQLWLFVAPGLYKHERRFAYLLAPLSLALSVLGVAFCYFVMFPITLAFLINFGSTIAQPGIRTAPVPEGVQLAAMPVLRDDPDDPPAGSMWYNSTLKQLRFCAAHEEKAKPVVLGTALVSAGAIAQQYRVSEYVGMLMALCVAFAVSFQMPVAVLLLGWAGLVQIPFLTKYRKHALFICACLGAVLTPTADPFTMSLLTVPLYALYELGILLLRFLPASRVAAGFGGKKAEADGSADE